MALKRTPRRTRSECGTLLVMSQHRATQDFLDYIRDMKSDLDWEVIDRWTEQGTGYLVVYLGAQGENLFELVAQDDEELLGKVLGLAASDADDLALTQFGGIGPWETLEAINARWVALGGLPNPRFDRSISLH